MLYRLIAPDWLLQQSPELPKVLEDSFSPKQISEYNNKGYNVYYFPNPPTEWVKGQFAEGHDVDIFEWVFVDCDLKDKVYASKEAFLETVINTGIPFTKVVDSGNGVHVYWKITNLDGMSYLRFQRRLMRLFKTDPAVAKILQLMRCPGTTNTKKEGAALPCILEYTSDVTHTAEQLDRLLPNITAEDERYCNAHFETTYSTGRALLDIPDTPAPKFGKLLRDNLEAKQLWSGNTNDRSKNDWRLAHLMLANDFTREEAASVLVNSAKASQRAPVHRLTYAQNIIDKIWTFELVESKDKLDRSQSVTQLLRKGTDTAKGQPFRCHPYVDNTHYGFRLTQVIGLVAGSGVGKTAFALNMFRWFAQRNPDYDHFFIPLEQPGAEIAARWATMCGQDTILHDKIQIMSNYDDAGNYLNLSLHEIKEYIQKYSRVTGRKVGCVVIDHIGVLRKIDKTGRLVGLEDVCHDMKSFAVETNTLLVMQSQTSREKAGIGDLELNKDAAYGTVYFESYCDYLITLWQPLKRCHHEQSCPTATAFKFCKIRHKMIPKDRIHEDIPYYLMFDPAKEHFRELTQDEAVSFNYFLGKATSMRRADRKTDLVVYQAAPSAEEVSIESRTDRH